MPEYDGPIPPPPNVKEQVELLHTLVLEGIRVWEPYPVKGGNAKMRDEAAWMIAAHLFVNGARVEKRRKPQNQRRSDATG